MKLTDDKFGSFLATADAIFEKYFWVKQSEKGAPFARPCRASFAHSATEVIYDPKKHEINS